MRLTLHSFVSDTMKIKTLVPNMLDKVQRFSKARWDTKHVLLAFLKSKWKCQVLIEYWVYSIFSLAIFKQRMCHCHWGTDRFANVMGSLQISVYTVLSLGWVLQFKNGIMARICIILPCWRMHHFSNDNHRILKTVNTNIE